MVGPLLLPRSHSEVPEEVSPVRRWSSPFLLCVMLSVVAACGGPSESSPVEERGLYTPTQVADVAPMTSEGRTVELGKVGSVVVPQGATVEERAMSGGTQQVIITFGDVTVSGVEITWGPDDPVSVDEQTWTMEQAAQVNKSISEYERARATWPGSPQSVLATWKESVADAEGGSSSLEGLRLVVQDKERSTVVAVGYAPEGDLAGSDAESVVLSLTLG